MMPFGNPSMREQKTNKLKKLIGFLLSKEESCIAIVGDSKG